MSLVEVHKHLYVYQEEINDGILKQFPVAPKGFRPTVLDVGCGSGALSEAIASRGYTVWGIEQDAGAAKSAAERNIRIVKADLTQVSEASAAINGQMFDYLVFSDVLEHLYDPFYILREYLKFLKTGGILMISVPNAVVWSNRIAFLIGRFNYSDTGVMDRTHLRFFTFKSAKELIRHAGCDIVRVDYTPFLVRAALPLVKKMFDRGQSGAQPRTRQIIDSTAYKCYTKYVYPIEYALGWLWKSLFAFRIIIIAQKK